MISTISPPPPTSKVDLRRALKRSVCAWTLLVIVLSLSPFDVKERFGTETHSHSIVLRQRTNLKHRLAHFAAFGALAAALAMLSRNRAQILWTGLAPALLGLALEQSQSLIYATRFEYWDVRDDIIGVLLGLVVGRLILRMRLVRLKLDANPESRVPLSPPILHSKMS